MQTSNTTVVPLGPLGPAVPPSPAPQPSARQARPLVISAGGNSLVGQNAAIHLNLSDATAIGLSLGGDSWNSPGLDVRRYVAAERNWSAYVQPGLTAIPGGDRIDLSASAQAGVEWRTDSGLAFNAAAGGAYSLLQRQLQPMVSLEVGLAF